MKGAFHHLSRMWKYWRGLPLVKRFALAGSVFIVAAMAFCGHVITTFTIGNLLEQRGGATSLFMDGVIAPLLSELAEDGTISFQRRQQLDRLMAVPSFSARFPYLEVWLPDGTVAYSNSRSIAGRRFDLPQGARRAFGGQVVTTFSDLHAQEHVVRTFTVDFVEVYAPVRAAPNGAVVAVAEIHEDTGALRAALLRVTVVCWSVIGATSLVVMGGLFSIVLGGSRLIERQRRALSKRLQQSLSLNQRYLEMKERAQRSSRDVTELTDTYLRGIGADLHDGPAQMIGFATLKVEQARRADDEAGREMALYAIEASLRDALDDIRNISRGLVLPDIENLPLDQVVDQAVHLHRQRTGVDVHLDNRIGPLQVGNAINICVFRFVQEGLSNAYHHGLWENQQVTGHVENGVLHLAVLNNNPTVAHRPRKGSRIGLQGLRARLEAIGGHIDFSQQDGRSRLTMSLALSERSVNE